MTLADLISEAMTKYGMCYTSACIHVMTNLTS